MHSHGRYELTLLRSVQGSGCVRECFHKGLAQAYQTILQGEKTGVYLLDAVNDQAQLGRMHRINICLCEAGENVEISDVEIFEQQAVN